MSGVPISFSENLSTQGFVIYVWISQIFFSCFLNILSLRSQNKILLYQFSHNNYTSDASRSYKNLVPQGGFDFS